METVETEERTSTSDVQNLTVEEVKVLVCSTVRQLDDALGRPPFPNPSTSLCRFLARTLLNLLNHLRNVGRISILGQCTEINMTFPVLCASLKDGSEGREPCLHLMELLLECLCIVNRLSLYPLQSILRDARGVLPNSALTFKLFALTGALDKDTMCSFFGVEQSTVVTEGKARSGRGFRKARGKQVPKDEPHSQCKNERPQSVPQRVPRDLMMAALDVVLPPECTKLFLSLLNGVEKFQHAVGNDSELASRIFNVYGEYLISSLNPMALIECLDVPVLDVFIDIVQMRGEKSMILLTELVFVEKPLVTWTVDRPERLVRYCVEREVKSGDAFGSLLVYIFLCRLLVKFGEGKMCNISFSQESLLWRAIVKSYLLCSSNEGEAVRFLQPLSIFSKCIRMRHTLYDICEFNVTEGGVLDHLDAAALLERMMATIHEKRRSVGKSCSEVSDSFRKKRKILPGKAKHIDSRCRSQEEVDDACYHQIGHVSEAICVIMWLAPPSMCDISKTIWNVVESIAGLLHPASENRARRGLVPTSTWECFLDALTSALYIWKPNVVCASGCEGSANNGNLGHKTLATLLTATQITRKLECCGLVAQRLPSSYTSSNSGMRVYRLLLNVWLAGGPPLECFYLKCGFPSRTESMGLVLDLLDQRQMAELADVVVEGEPNASHLLSEIQKTLEDCSLTSRKALRALSSLHASLMVSMTVRQRGLEEQRKREEDAKTAELLAAAERAEALQQKVREFEEEAKIRHEHWERERSRVEKLREERQRERDEKRNRELLQAQERKREVLSVCQEVSEKSKVAKEAEQKERTRLYRAHMSAMSRMSAFLETLQLSSKRVMEVVNALGPRISSMTHDSLLEFVVTGSVEVPSDMQSITTVTRIADDEGASVQGIPGEVSAEGGEAASFDDKSLSFWDSVMQFVESSAKHRRNVNCVSTDSAASGLASFHHQVTQVLNLFDYAVGSNGDLPDSLPTINIRTATRMLTSEAFVGTTFANVREALLSCQERGLCVVRGSTCTLTPLGFRYHFPFRDPDATLELQLERRRAAAGAMLTKRNIKEDKDDNLCDDEAISDNEMFEDSLCVTDPKDDDIVWFCDEVI